jgi:hypothetical protein
MRHLLLLVIAYGCAGHVDEKTRDPWEDCRELVPEGVYVQPTPGGACIFRCSHAPDLCEELGGYCEINDLCTGVLLD